MRIFFKIINRLVIGFGFYKRVYLLRKKLIKVDSKSPFKGSLAESGYAKFNFSDKTIGTLIDLYKSSKNSNNINYKISLTVKQYSALKEIFDLACLEVKNYLGSEAYLDGLNWMKTSKLKTHPIKKKSESISWHTDNVGARLKMFVCVRGFGCQPTLVVPSKHRIPSLYGWITTTLIESLRWFGVETKYNIKKSVPLKHTTGSSYIFDTQLLHRGSYENGKNSRIIFLLEFSVPEKHKLSSGPIGTKHGYNAFSFEKNLLKISSFKSLLDPNRFKKKKDLVLYG